MLTVKDSAQGMVRGRVGLGRFTEQGIFIPRFCKPNQIQLTWGVIAARQIGYKRQAHRPDYSISAMYIEFENVADPTDEVAVPTFSRDDAMEYYEALSASSVRDVVRVPLRMEPTLGVADAAVGLIPDGEGNMLTFFAMTSATTGIHGKTFSAGVNSKICGMGLVATPVFDDRTQDILFARTYLAPEDQQVKDASAQAGVEWDIIFG